MKPGDLVRPLAGYTEIFPIPCGIIIEESNLAVGFEVTRFNVLFPQGVFPMFSYEMELVQDPCNPPKGVV